jgi:hypothetical protein
MNIFAFGQFQYRKPPTEKTRRNSISYPVKNQIANEIEIDSIDAYPSLPSKKLKRLINHTKPTISIKIQSHEKLLLRRLLDPLKKYKAIPEHIIWVVIRKTGLRFLKSSTNPTKARTIPGSKAKNKSFSICLVKCKNDKPE